MKIIKEFLKKCTTELDTYNMEECVSILKDSQGVEFATYDHINSRANIEAEIYIKDVEHILTEKEIDYIFDFLIKETEDEKSEWESNYEIKDEDQYLEQRY